MKVMRLILVILFLLNLSITCGDGLEDEFRDPPERTRPWCYWFFLDGDITEEGITKYLEKMKELGVQQAIIMHVQNGRSDTGLSRILEHKA